MKVSDFLSRQRRELMERAGVPREVSASIAESRWQGGGQ